LATLVATVVFSVVPFDVTVPWGIVTDLHVVGWLRLVSTGAVIAAVTMLPRRAWPVGDQAPRSWHPDPTGPAASPSGNLTSAVAAGDVVHHS
jgi:hypothetical protein